MYRHIQACTHTQSYWIPPGHIHTHWLSPTHTHTHTHKQDPSYTQTHRIPHTHTHSLDPSYSHIHTLTGSLLHTHTHTHTGSLLHMHTDSLDSSYTYTLTGSLLLTHTHTYWISPTHTHTHTHTRDPSYTHTQTHWIPHTHTLTGSLLHTHTHWIPPTYTQSLASSYAHTHSLDPSHTHTLTQLVLSRLIWKPLSRALRSPGISGHPGPPQLRVNWSLVPFSVTSSFTGEPRSRWMRVREGRMHLQGGSCLFREAGGRKSFQRRTFLLFSSFLVPSLIQKPSLNGSFIEKDIFPLLGKCCPLTQRDVHKGGFSSHCFTS